MKFFKYFTYSELKDICLKFEKKNCYYRHPQSDFIEILGHETVDKLLETGCLKDSPLSGKSWDYTYPCYEFGKWFRKLYNFVTVPFCLWFRIYILHTYWFRIKWQSFRIWCGHHYDWQDYEGVDLDTI